MDTFGSVGEARPAAPGRGWYALIVAVVVGTVVVTGVLGVMRATDLVATVEDFQRFDATGDRSVWIDEPGEYAVYRERLGGGVSPASESTASETALAVMGPDGADVPVVPSTVRYGWGSRQGEGIGSFLAEEPGEYRIRSTVPGGLAFGPRIPGSPLYGTGGLLLIAGLVLVACILAAVALAARRHGRAAGDGASDGDRRMSPALVVAGLVVVVAAGAGVAAWVSDDVEDTVMSADLPGGGAASSGGGSSGTPGAQPPPECVSDADFETGLCGTSPEDLREMNLDYADRMDFAGDLAAATLVAEDARAALEPLAPILPAPSTDAVHNALLPVSEHVTVSANAVRTGGTAFGIAVDGGCVFGNVNQGAVEVEVGGYVNDGGCLASYGH
jgi:hypothetical protein